MCALTRTRLPGFFLQDFGLITHPETGAPWLIPHSLIPDEPIEVPFEPDTERSLSVPEASSSSGKGGDVEATTTTTTTESSSPSHGLRDDDARPRGPGAYVLARRDLLSSFVVNQSGFENAHRRMTATNFKHKNLAGKAVWRRDMDSYILDLLRQAVVGDLLYLSRLCVEGQRHYMVKCYGWGDVRFKHKGAVLWFGEPEEEEGQGSSDRTQTQIGTGTGAGTGNGNSNEPGPFATFDTQREDARHEEVVTTRLAVHNMPMLLGAERAGRVKEGAAALKHGSIFMLAGRRTADLQMKLWKLQGYLSDYREI
ncbi:hypothetical protein GGR53DRAFT_479999 [Hypoxylon sp. FL1150]|nr:hypothetical protein GGR53DRAFT_479999 [Hypoxylon sp. FL1150]